MDIDSIRHKPLRRLFEEGATRGIDGKLVDCLRKMLAYIVNAESFEELGIPPNCGLHPLTGDRDGIWAMTVTRNWRLTFRKVDDRTLAELDLEDYH